MLVTLGLVGASLPLFAYFVPEETDKYAGLKEFNSYKYDQFGDFTKNWHLVTVRYRKDSEEMRIVYANEKAWQSLKNGAKKYPDGSIFAKIGLKTETDPSFASSVVPSGGKRIQYMVRNAKLHSATGGWGYALFDSEGKTFPGEPKAAQVACYACHQIVTNKNYVFSEIASISLKGGKPAGRPALPTLEFEEIPSSKLPSKIRDLVLPAFNSVSSLKGNIRNNIFPGTIDEIRIFLSQEATIRKRPALLFNEDGTAFSLVYPIFDEKCPSPGAPTLQAFTKGSKDAPEPTKLTFCN